MTPILDTATHFLIFVGAGTFLFTALVNESQMGIGFFKTLLMIAFSSTLLALFFNLLMGKWVWPLIFAGLFAIQYRLLRYPLLAAKFKMAFYVILACIITIYCYFQNIQFHFLMMTFLVLGIVHYLMLLGHWYLVTPKLSTKPLSLALLLVALFLICKLLLSFFLPPTFWEAINHNHFDFMLVVTRYVVGYLGILVLAFMANKLVKVRDTQNATGLFYVMVIFVFIGELLGGVIGAPYGVWP